MRRLPLLLLLAALLLLAGAAAVLVYLGHSGVAPRTLAPYVERRSSGHNPVIVGVGSALARQLTLLDRGPAAAAAELSTTLGAQASRAGAAQAGEVLVASSVEARVAIARARPGDVITFLPGRYLFEQDGLKAEQAGRADAPITVRAAQAGSVRLDFQLVEGFKVMAPYWRFENLVIAGACGEDDACEHAFHIVGRASHFVSRNNTILDFNAHFKINGSDGAFPDFGLIEGNTISNTRPRNTGNPVTLIDLVAASGWVVRANLISDFIKLGGNQVSYGAFFKGGGSGNRFERNLVLCEQHLRGIPGQRVGLSFGGGGSGRDFCRDRACITEQSAATMSANLIAGCSDVGIYLNSAANSRIEHNTLIDTAGIDVRFPTSSATVEGNLVDGDIRARNGALLRGSDNLDSGTARLYLGSHPVRALLRDPAALDFGWRETPPRRAQPTSALDLCGAARPATPSYGAFEDATVCVRPAASASSSAAN